MRKYHKDKLLELMGTLWEAHGEIKKLTEKNNQDAVAQLLADSQDCAFYIGSFIEKLEGEGTRTVVYLEEYCDILYQISISISDLQNVKKAVNMLKNQTIKIENSIRHDIVVDRLEVVFLPYKASMWDSLESIWLEAKNDPACDTLVVPIPYESLHSNGTVGERCYEGDQFPAAVPITSWQEYDLSEHHPDIIYIHNPYDDNNLITRVLPTYFSRNLKQYTDLLIYVPYYVSGHDEPEHFSTYPGNLYADRVITQTEKSKQNSIKNYRKFEKANGCVGRFGNPEKKFVALGSPKFDKVLQTKKEDCVVPEEWRKLIQRPDGSRKKVVLYNTSIAGLLEGNEKVLEKLQYVFACFKQRNDVVLLWRPHPLNIAAYESMRQYLLYRYIGLVEAYKNEGWGIYDNTADMNRAIAVSDAYYGDESSLVPLYQCTGKPIMLQDPDVNWVNQSEKSLRFECMHMDDELIWFSVWPFNGLFKMRRDGLLTEYIGSFPNEPRNAARLYGSVTEYRSKLYFVPLAADEIAVYDINNNSFDKIKLGLDQLTASAVVQYKVAMKFYASVQYKNWIFFVGCSFPAIVRYDTESGALDYFTDWVEPLDKLVNNAEDCYFRHAHVNGSCMMAPAHNANAVVVFNMETCASFVHEVGSKNCAYSGICFDGKDYWLSPRHVSPVVRWSPETLEYKEYNQFPDGFVKDKISFWNINYANGYVWLFPNRANMALKIDIKRDKIEMAEEFQEECHAKAESLLLQENYTRSVAIEDVIYASTGKSNKFISYNTKTRTKHEETIVMTDLDFMKVAPYRSGVYNKDGARCEVIDQCNYYEDHTSQSLDDFIGYINSSNFDTEKEQLSLKQKEICRSTFLQHEGNSGKEIYEYSKRMLKGEGL